MRKRIKGFTLIECIVALAVLGIASLTMAQIYAAVSRRNTMTHLVNTSLSNQMAYVEKYTDSEAVKVAYGGSTSTSPPHTTDTAGAYNHMTVTKLTTLSNPDDDEFSYSFPVDLYVLKSRDRDDVKLEDSSRNAGYTEADYNLRYKYILGHT